MTIPLAQAFSLRRNLTLLVRRPSERFGAVDGLRAVAILWTVAFHAVWYLGWSVPPRAYFATLFDRALLPIWRGHTGVDLFFVLSGFLIGGMLLDERERTGRIRFGLFYLRRLLRLWPALAAAVLVYALIGEANPMMLWANLLYVSNFVPVLATAMPWTWSLAIEEQFYLLAPWMIAALGPRSTRSRLAALGATALAFVLLGVMVVVFHDLHARDSEIALDREITVWARAFDVLYTKPWMRVGPLLAGVGAAVVKRHARTMAFFDDRPIAAALGAVLALVVLAFSTEWPWVVGRGRAIEIAYLAGFRTTLGAALAYLLLFSLAERGLGGWLGRALASRPLLPIAQLAYPAYLLNPMVTIAVEKALAPRLLARELPLVPILLPVTTVATFAAALVLHLAVERPIMELRPRADGRT